MDSTDRDVLEKNLEDPTAPPIYLPLQFLKDITCNFSTEQELGRGGYGVVYRGVLRSQKVIAVKKLFEIHLMEDDQFQNEVSYLMEIRHQNVVQLVGYCAESRWEATRLPSGKYVMAQMPTRLLCFEYLCNKSLDKHVTDESSGLNWSKRYDIIKGICSGLHFLHVDCHIVHLDLKPENILMDATMVPKIADFGLSRLLGAQKSRTIISGNFAGSLGYMAPEYLLQGVVTPKADIFGLGVIIIEIITGCRDYPQSTASYIQNFDDSDIRQSIEMSHQKFIDKVIGRWRNIFQTEPKFTLPEIYTQQVKQCITIALQCVDHDLKKRPSAWDILESFSAVETTHCHARDCEDSLAHEKDKDKKKGNVGIVETEDYTEGCVAIRMAFERYLAMGKKKEISPQDAARIIQTSYKAHLARRSQDVTLATAIDEDPTWILSHGDQGKEKKNNKVREGNIRIVEFEDNTAGCVAIRKAFKRYLAEVKRKEMSPQDAARMIQMSYKAHLAHRSQVCLRHLGEAKAKLKEIRSLYYDITYRLRILHESEERQRFSEKIIVLLLTIDAVEEPNYVVRNAKRSMLEELEGMLEIVDPSPGGGAIPMETRDGVKNVVIRIVEEGK